MGKAAYGLKRTNPPLRMIDSMNRYRITAAIIRIAGPMMYLSAAMIFQSSLSKNHMMAPFPPIIP